MKQYGFEKLSDEVYEKWNNELAGKSKDTIREAVDQKHQAAFDIVNFISQVNNGGIYQYWDNGYASALPNVVKHIDNAAKMGIPKMKELSELLVILKPFELENKDPQAAPELQTVECGCGGDEDCDVCGGDGQYEDYVYESEELYASLKDTDFDNQFYDLCAYDASQDNALFDALDVYFSRFGEDVSHITLEKPFVKPRCQLVGIDGNVFNILGTVRRSLIRAGYKNKADELMAKTKQFKSYDEALATCMEYVDVF